MRQFTATVGAVWQAASAFRYGHPWRALLAAVVVAGLAVAGVAFVSGTFVGPGQAPTSSYPLELPGQTSSSSPAGGDTFEPVIASGVEARDAATCASLAASLFEIAGRYPSRAEVPPERRALVAHLSLGLGQVCHGSLAAELGDTFRGWESSSGPLGRLPALPQPLPPTSAGSRTPTSAATGSSLSTAAPGSGSYPTPGLLPPPTPGG